MSDVKKSTVRDRFGLGGPAAGPPPVPPLLVPGVLPTLLAAFTSFFDESSSTSPIHHLFERCCEEARAKALAEFPDAAAAVFARAVVMSDDPVHQEYRPLREFKYPDNAGGVGGSPVFATAARTLADERTWLEAVYAREATVAAHTVFWFTDAEDTDGRAGREFVPAIRQFFADFPNVRTVLITPDEDWDRAGAAALTAPNSAADGVIAGRAEEMFPRLVAALTTSLKAVSRKVSTKRPAPPAPGVPGGPR